MPQKSRIETLPADLRDEIETLIDSGATEQAVADYLNDVLVREEGQTADQIKRSPITQQNINRWKSSEYRARKAAKEIAKNFEQIAETEDRHKHLENILAWLTAKLAAQILEIDRNPPTPADYLKTLHALISDAATLRKLENDNQWLDAEKRRVGIGESKHVMQLKLEARKLEEKAAQKRAEEAASEGTQKYADAAERILDKLVQEVDDEHQNKKDDAKALNELKDSLTQDQVDALAAILDHEQLAALGIETPQDEAQDAAPKTPEPALASPPGLGAPAE